MPKTYFSLLPRELLELLVLNNIYYDDLRPILDLEPFDKLFMDDVFLHNLWRKHIATEKYNGDMPILDKYFEVVNELYKYKDSTKLVFIINNDYDQLLKHHLNLMNISTGRSKFTKIIIDIVSENAKNTFNMILNNLPLTLKEFNMMGRISADFGRSDFIVMLYDKWQQIKKPNEPNLDLNDILLNAIYRLNIDTVKSLIKLGAE